MTDSLRPLPDLMQVDASTLSPELVGQVCAQTLAEPVNQLFASLERCTPAPPETLPEAAYEAYTLQQQRWYETLLRAALPAAARTGSAKHLARVKDQLDALPLSEAFMRTARETAAVQAAATGCVEAVLTLLEEAPDESMMLAASTAAAASGRLSVLQALLDDGLSDDALTRALIGAAAGGHLGAVAALLLAAGERASHVAQADFGGITAVGAAARLGALDVVRELWPWQTSATRAAALVNAAAQGSQSVLSWALSQPTPDADDTDGAAVRQAGLGQALRAAAAGGHVACVESLLACLGSEPPMPALEEAFFAAAATGKADILERLAQAAGRARRDALVSARGDGALQVAANAGHVDAMAWLLDAAGERRLSVLRSDDDGAFCSAAAGGHDAAVAYLLEQVDDAARAQMLAAYRYEPLREAAAHGHLATVKHLVAAPGVDIAAALQVNDFEALRRAAAEGHVEVVQCLLQAAGSQADRMLRARRFAALTGAAQRGHASVVEALLQALGEHPAEVLGTQGDAVLQAAAKGGNLALLASLLSQVAASTPEVMQSLGESFITTHFLDMPGDPGRHAPLHQHMDLLRAWAPGVGDNVRRQALATALTDGEPALAALFI